MELLYELLPGKADAIVALNELEKGILELLRKRKLVEAVQLLKKITSSERLVELGRETLEIAKSLGNSEIIKQLSKLPFSENDKNDFFIFTIRALLEINEDAAVAHVFFTPLSKESPDLGWHFLVAHFRKRGDLQKLEVIYDNLSEKYEKTELAKHFLNEESIQKNWLSWLLWYGRYCSLSHPHVDTYMHSKAIELLVGQDNVSGIAGVVNQAFSRESKKAFLETLYMHWIKSLFLVRCQQLENDLPAELGWLTQVRELVTSGRDFDVVSKVSFEFKRDIIFLGLSQVFKNTGFDSEVSVTLADRASEAPDCRQQILVAGCQQCIELDRIDDAIVMLSHFDQYQVQKFIEMMVAKGELNEVQQTNILMKVTFNDVGWDKIKSSFSLSLVEAEQRCRTDAMFGRVRKEYLSLKNIGSKHKKYHDVCLALADLIRHHLYDQALELCAILAPSHNRDDYVSNFLSVSLEKEPVNFDFVVKACELFSDKKARDGWKNFFAMVRAAKDRDIVKASIKCQSKPFAQRFISASVARILNEEDINSAIEFLRSSGFLASNWRDRATRLKVVSALVIIYKNNLSKLVKRIRGWIKSDLGDYAPLVIEYLLEKDEFKQAIVLLNGTIKGLRDDEVVDDACFRLVSTYLQKCSPAKELFSSISVLEDKSAGRCLMKEVCHTACRTATEISILVVSSCPNKELRGDYLEALLVSWLCKSQFDLATKTLDCLDLELKNFWRPVLEYFKVNRYRDIVSHWCNSGQFIKALTCVVAEKWLKDLPVDEILVEFSHIYKFRQQYAQIVPFVDEASLDNWVDRYTAKTECDRILDLIASQWLGTFEGRVNANVSDISEGIRIILPWQLECNHISELHNKVSKMVIELVTPNNFIEIERYMVMLLEYKQLTPGFLDLLEARLLNLGAYVEQERLIQFTRVNAFEHWATYARERLTNDYLKNKMFNEVISFLPNNMAFSERRALMGCVEQHIKAVDLPRVKCIIDKLTINIQEAEVLPLVSYLLKALYVLEANALFRQHVTMPTQVHALAKRVIKYYWKKMALLLSPEGETAANFICASYNKIAQIKIDLDKGNNQDAIRLKTEIVLEMRPLLDIAFKAFCIRSFPGAHIKNLYFPMVAAGEIGDPSSNLEQLLRNNRLPRFRVEKPDMFNFILSIQPIVNRKYLWLETLFSTCNVIKHESNRAAETVTVDFLIDAVNGVSLILLKLLNLGTPLPELEQYLPSAFIDLNQLMCELSNQDVSFKSAHD
jgi:hypothetical protein